MGSIFGRQYINRLLLLVVLTTFTVTFTTPLPAAPLPNFNQVAFLIRIEKLAEKLAKSQKKEPDYMMDVLIDIKNEIEVNYNTKINLDKFIDQTGKEISKKGVKSPKTELDAIKKKLKSKEKKKKQHAAYIAHTMYLEDYQMNSLDEEMMFSTKNKDDAKDEIEIPSLLVYGITCTLCGLFLIALPVPACKDWGAKMVVAGITASANSICATVDKNKKKEISLYSKEL